MKECVFSLIEYKMEILYGMARNLNIEIRITELDKRGSNNFDGENFHILINKNLYGFEKASVSFHEMGHILKDGSTHLSRPFVHKLGERRAQIYAAVNLVTCGEYRALLRNPYIRNDFEAAEELGVDIETLRLAARRYKLQGLF